MPPCSLNLLELNLMQKSWQVNGNFIKLNLRIETKICFTSSNYDKLKGLYSLKTSVTDSAICSCNHLTFKINLIK